MSLSPKECVWSPRFWLCEFACAKARIKPEAWKGDTGARFSGACKTPPESRSSQSNLGQLRLWKRLSLSTDLRQRLDSLISRRLTLGEAVAGGRISPAFSHRNRCELALQTLKKKKLKRKQYFSRRAVPSPAIISASLVCHATLSIRWMSGSSSLHGVYIPHWHRKPEPGLFGQSIHFSSEIIPESRKVSLAIANRLSRAWSHLPVVAAPLPSV